MATIGFSTGAVAKGDFTKALKLLDSTRSNAVELSALRYDELRPLQEALPFLLPQIRPRYSYISFHAPTKVGDERALTRELKKIANYGLNIVVHPDIILNFKYWRELGSRLCLENMDSRKPTGRTVEELEPFFNELPDAKLCLDLAHARQIDSSMNQAVRILKRFGNRLVQFHLSEINSKGTHFGMSVAALRAYQPFASVLAHTPIIIESVVGVNEIGREIRITEEIVIEASAKIENGYAA